MEYSFFRGLLAFWFAFAAMTFVSLKFITVPYGRHVRSGWGPAVPGRLGWFFMELPALIVAPLLIVGGDVPLTATGIVFAALWGGHYVWRTLIYPRLMAGTPRPMPISIMMPAVVFNLGNGYLNGRWVGHFSGGYAAGWLADPRFLIGVVVFVCGFAIHFQSDAILRGLRSGGETGYKIPRGGLYRWISCPNYFGEILEWTGWAIATWSVAGLSFAVWTAANLVPRAVQHHRWYREAFDDYPPERKAVVPGLL